MNGTDPNQRVTIISRKFDGTTSRSWECVLLERSDDLLTFRGEFAFDVDHPHLGFIRRGTVSYEYYWLDRWYNVFRFHEPEGELRNYYCNINMPPRFEKGVLDYIDLDVDLLVSSEFNYQVLDLDDFEVNAARFGYSDELKSKVDANLEVLIGMIERRDFPFVSAAEFG